MFSQLQNEDQLAGVIGHEIGHVLGKHSNGRITNANFWNVNALDGSAIDTWIVAQKMGQGQLLKNGRGDELESDELGVQFMMDAGYTLKK